MTTWKPLIPALIQAHFDPMPLDSLTITERQSPFRVRADLQRALDNLFDGDTKMHHFSGVKKRLSHEGLKFSGLVVHDALDELLFRGGSLNRKLLGGQLDSDSD